MNLEAAKHATYHAAKLYDSSGKGSNITPQAVGVACNSAKYLAAEAAFTACERAVRMKPSVDSALKARRCSHMVEWAMPRSITSSAISESAWCPELHLLVG